LTLRLLKIPKNSSPKAILAINMISLSSTQKSQLRLELTRTGDWRVYRRATALLALDEGLSPRQVANLFGITRQTVYNWITAYGCEGEDFDLADSPRCGRPTLWTEDLQQFIQQTMCKSPSDFGFGAAHWSAKMLQSHLASARETRVSKEALRRYLRALGYGWVNGRYVSSPGGAADALALA
jgi:transposase